MMKAGYSPQLAVGTISIAGTLAIMIPPSVAFVIYGVVTETSIGKLFLAGVTPGLMTMLGYILTISLTLKFKPEWGPSDADKEERKAMEVGLQNEIAALKVLDHPHIVKVMQLARPVRPSAG